MEYETGLLGRWFWFDTSAPPMRDFYHGEFVSDLGDGYWLVRFNQHRLLRDGTQEVVHLQRIVAETWMIFDTQEDLAEALAHGPA